MQLYMAVAKRVLQCGWLTTDEVSIVRVKFLSEVHVQVCFVMREIGPMGEKGRV